MIDIEALKSAVKTAKPLYSIFDRVQGKNYRFKDEGRTRLPAGVLTASGLALEVGFPELSEEALQTDLDRLGQLTHPEAIAATVPYLIQKHGWRIADPEASEKFPDAAFCDAYRVRSALAQASTNGSYLLVKGDLTGIQDYIYHNIQPKQAGGLGRISRRLRARSMTVTLLTDFIANTILRELGLPSWHLLFAGGGHFNLLLPGDESTEIRLQTIAESIDRNMRAEFGDRLELVVAAVRCVASIEKNASNGFTDVNQQRDRLKFTQHLGQFNDLFDAKIDDYSRNDEEIGRVIPKCHWLMEAVSHKPLDIDPQRHLKMARFEIDHCHTVLLFKNLGEVERFLLINQANGLRHVQLLHLNNTDFLSESQAIIQAGFSFPISFGYRFLGKNAPKPLDENGVEKTDGDILDFEKLATGEKERKKGEGFLRLGSLMLDVDNLGLIFSHGLGQDATLARIVTLSRELNYFFTAHFDQRAREHRIYVVYSGGDDAFAVGKWDSIMRFADVLQHDFQRFINHAHNKNPDVTFSAGIFMSNPYYPIGRFYRDTKALQDKAKGGDKNSVDVFNHTLSWSSYADKIRLGDMFRDVLEKGQTESGRKFTASFAYRIMQLVKSSYYERDERQNGEFHRRGTLRIERFARNVASVRYLFARHNFAQSDIEKLTGDLEKRLTQSFLQQAFSFGTGATYNARDYLVALNFAMLQVRSTDKTPVTHG